jgi:hypothetical protein
MPLQATSGAASYDAFGGGVVAEPNYIESVFSTWLYTGNDYTQTITNGIDLAGKGGLVWIKQRGNPGTNYHNLVDTNRGVGKYICSNLTDAQTDGGAFNLSAFGSAGFTVGSAGGAQGLVNQLAATYASWTFRKQPKFFDVVTYTGNGTSQAIAHNLTSPPGCIIIKATSAAEAWVVYARYDEIDPTTPLYKDLRLNTTAASTQNVAIAGATTFTVGGLGDPVNTNGVTYVAYLFAHNAGGFGLTGTDNVISCGSFNTGSGEVTVNLGYEPQWILIKPTSTTGSWSVIDNMRSFSLTGSSSLSPNNANAESTGFSDASTQFNPTATGFHVGPGWPFTSTDYIYIAIRRGPMKVPTDGTKVFNVVSQTPSGTTTVSNSFASDMVLSCQRSNGGGWGFNVADKLRGSSIANGSRYLTTPTTAAEGNFSGFGFNLTNTNVQENFWNSALGVSTPVVYDMFQRAPGFFDEVCYMGTSANQDVAHNLAAVPELIITKTRGTAGTNWWTFSNFTGSVFNRTAVNLTDAASSFNYAVNAGFYSQPTSTNLPLSPGVATNTSGRTYVAYLFATCPGVSKCGSYTGTGTTQTINCGFTAGARFVMIKRTDSTGDWYVWDSARGIVAGNDPYLLLNSTAAEVTGTDYIDTAATGFEISSTAPAAINASGGTFIFLAIA